MTYSLLESGQPDTLLLPALGRVIKQDTRAQDVDLPIVEDPHEGQESAVGVPERIREKEAVNETTEYGEGAHDGEEPEPAGLTTDAAHVQDAVRQEL